MDNALRVGVQGATASTLEQESMCVLDLASLPLLTEFCTYTRWARASLRLFASPPLFEFRWLVDFMLRSGGVDGG